jgi:predicted RecB family nuclease
VALRIELERIGVTTGHGLLSLGRPVIESIPGLERLHAGARALSEGAPVLMKRPKLPREGAHGFVGVVRDAFLDRSLHFGLLDSAGVYSGFSSAELGDEGARAACLARIWNTEGPVYHLGGKPALHLAGVGRNGGPPADHRLVDLRPVLWGSVVLPFRGQDVRSLAECFRFEELAAEPEGMPAVWFERWRETGDPAWLARIAARNEAELRLLRAVHCWLLEARQGS